MVQIYSGVRAAERAKRVENEIDTNSANPQSESLLFGLPAEIRLLIYEHVFGTGVVHVLHRGQETPREREERLARAERSFFWLESHPGHEEEPEWKLTYTICQKPNDWAQTYALSKVPATFPDEYFRRDRPHELRRMDPLPSDLIGEYRDRHYGCLQPIAAFVSQEYVECCEHANHCKGQNMPNPDCNECASERAQLTEAYGPPLTGLRKLHASSAFDLAILETCKQIYHEARALPFALYMFDGTSVSTLMDFAWKFLTPFQAAAIETIHVDGIDMEMDGGHFLTLLRTLPGLKNFRLSWDSDFYLQGRDTHWKKFFAQNTSKSALLIFGYDGINMKYDPGSDRIDQRPDNRAAAETFERLFVSSSMKQACLAMDMDMNGTADGREHDDVGSCSDDGSEIEIWNKNDSDARILELQRNPYEPDESSTNDDDSGDSSDEADLEVMIREERGSDYEPPTDGENEEPASEDDDRLNWSSGIEDRRPKCDGPLRSPRR